MTEIVLRPARRTDAPAIARLFLVASDGLAEYIWSQLAEPGEDLATVGARRYARKGVAFSYQNCTMVEQGGAILGMLHAFPMEQDSLAEPVADPVLRPYSELEDYGSLYISALAVVEAARGAGLGTRLLEEADAQARTRNLTRVSLICFEKNEGAMKLYLRHGYRSLDRRAIVSHSCLHYSEGDAILLAKEVG